MPTRTVHDLTTGAEYEVEFTQEEIDQENAVVADHAAWVQDEQAKHDAYHAQKAAVQQLRDAAMNLEIDPVALAALPLVAQQMYQIIEWLREEKRLDDMDKGALPDVFS